MVCFEICVVEHGAHRPGTRYHDGWNKCHSSVDVELNEPERSAW